jgi:hypothetical protein
MQVWKTRLAMGLGLLIMAGLAVVSVPPARAAFENVMSCAHSTPCLTWENTGTGDSIKGISTNGNALHGQTKFNSTGKTAGKSGVFGEDLSTTGTLDSGVLGTSTNGAGITGTSSTYNAVQGLSTGSSGVYGQTAGAGAYGAAGRNVATTHNPSGAGELADGGPSNDGLHVFANGASSNAIYAFSQAGSALFANQGPSDDAPEVYLADSNEGNYIIQSVGASGDALDVADGNTWAYGTVHISRAGLGSGLALNVSAGTANSGPKWSTLPTETASFRRLSPTMGISIPRA